MEYPKYEIITISIRKFFTDWALVTNVNPITQRNAGMSYLGNVKFPQIISAIKSGVNIGMITLTSLPDDSPWKFESIDGANRKRAILDFLNGRITDAEMKYFREYSEEERNRFMDTSLTFCNYIVPLTNEQKGQIFRSVNTVTPVNHQEMLNSFGNIEIANAIREIVRVVEKDDGTYTQPHSFFTNSLNGDMTETERKYVFINGKNLNKRMNLEEKIAQLYYRFLNGGNLGSSNDNNLYEMYKNNPSADDVSLATVQVKNLLDFLEACSVQKKAMSGQNALAMRDVVMLSRIFLYANKELGGTPNFRNQMYAKAFVKEFLAAMNVYTRKNDTRMVRSLPDVVAFDTKDRTVSEAFLGYMGEFGNVKKILQSVLWLEEEFKNGILSYFYTKDSKRDFSKADKEAKLVEQNGLCYIDGQPLNMTEATAGHNIAHSNGGKTDYNNLVVIRAIHNQKMGAMDADVYRDVYYRNTNIAA